MRFNYNMSESRLNSGHCTSAHAETKKPHQISEVDPTPSSGIIGKRDNLLWRSQEKELVSRNKIYTKYDTKTQELVSTTRKPNIIYIVLYHKILFPYYIPMQTIQ